MLRPMRVCHMAASALFLLLLAGTWTASTAEDATPLPGVPRVRYPGHEHPKCRSQAEQFLYWKTQNLKPSEALLKAFRSYEVFHAKCRSQENNLTDAILNKRELPCKYLIWIATYDGIGNRLLSLASSLIHAMLTNRVLLVDHRWDIEQFLCEPFPWSSWSLPREIDTERWQRELQRIGDFTSYAAPLREKNEEIEVPYSIIADVNHAKEEDMTFFCNSEIEGIEKIPVILLRSNMYYIVGHYYTSYRETLEQWFPDRRVFTHVARYVLSPVNEIWDKIVNFWNENLANSTNVLGVQMRMYEHPWRREKSNRLVECSQTHGFLPPLREGASAGEGEGGKEEESGAVKKTTACLVASLHKEFYEHLVESFQRGSTAYDGHLVTVHKASQAEEQLSGRHDHNVDVMMEVWLLSFSDHLITSPGSTFGYIAAGLRGQSNFFLNGLFHNSDEAFTRSPCSLTEGEPCFARPPWKVKCFKDPPFDDPWHMAPGVVDKCFDYPRGTRIHVPPSGGNGRRRRR